MNKKMLSASLGALILGIQIGSPALGDVRPDKSLLDDLRLLDCRLLAGDRDGVKRLLDENGDLLRLIEGQLPECLPGEEGEDHANLHDFNGWLGGRGEGREADQGAGATRAASDSGAGHADSGDDDHGDDDWDHDHGDDGKGDDHGDDDWDHDHGDDGKDDDHGDDGKDDDHGDDGKDHDHGDDCKDHDHGDDHQY